ncbi:hypothetical protein QF017_005038 [Pseudomonas laurylsulfatiphila]|uniref:hypothetical protein n=1 Tax=Pseudomonas laurylsulfatiphila TaxID=2011015 RepID=UPI003D20586F
MLCEHFRYIDLENIYEQLDSFNSLESSKLSNIQEQFTDTLSFCFEELAYVAQDQDDENDWRSLPPIQVGTDVGDIIEANLEQIATAAEISLPSRRASATTAIEKLTTLSIHASFGEFDYWQKTSLLVYQYDLLCWLYSKDKIKEAFEVYELILRTYGELAASYALSHSFEKQIEIASNIARERAQKRHAPTNKIKTELLTEWDKTSGEYKSRADFCRIVARRDGIKERTLQEWIQSYERDRR